MIENGIIKADLNVLSQYVAWAIILSMGLWKGIKYLFPLIKIFLAKKTSKTDVTTNTTVNLNGTPLSTQDPQITKQEDKFLFYFLEQSKILYALHNLKSEILTEQMDNAKKHSRKIKQELTNIVIDLLKEAGIEDFDYTTYFSNFENFIDYAEREVLDQFEEMCKKNHFSEKSMSEYSELINTNTSLIEESIKDLMRRRYPQRKYIKNFNRVYGIQKDIKESLMDCFEYARKVAIQKEGKVNTAKLCFEIQVSEIIGMKYSLEI
jgi:hypothetical protein